MWYLICQCEYELPRLLPIHTSKPRSAKMNAGKWENTEIKAENYAWNFSGGWHDMSRMQSSFSDVTVSAQRYRIFDWRIETTRHLGTYKQAFIVQICASTMPTSKKCINLNRLMSKLGIVRYLDDEAWSFQDHIPVFQAYRLKMFQDNGGFLTKIKTLSNHVLDEALGQMHVDSICA